MPFKAILGDLALKIFRHATMVGDIKDQFYAYFS